MAALVVLLASLYVVARQPLGSPWWTYADPDATYAASSLNLLLGEHTHYFGHPGLPEQELLAVTFGAQRVLAGSESTRAFADERLLNLDRTRPVVRAWAIAFFLLGALLTFVVTWRVLGHWRWGLLGGLLWVAAPDFAAGSIQIRPDVLLSLLALAVVYLVVRAAEQRSALRYLGAAALLGLALTVKLHAVGLLVPLALAAALRPPPRGWWRESRTVAGRFLARRSRPLAIAAVGWLVLVVVLNRDRVPFSPTREELTLVLGLPALLGAWLAVAAAASRRLHVRALDPFYPALAAAIAGGIAVPMTLFLDDGFELVVHMREGLTGGGANEGIPLFTLAWSTFEAFPLRQAVVLFTLAGIAAVVGLSRRTLSPALWFAAAATMGVMAAARLGATRYFEPAYVLSIVPALWLFATRRAVTAPVAAAIVTAFVVWPSLHRAHEPALLAEAEQDYSAAVDGTARDLLAEHDVALVADYAPVADARYWGVVQNFVAYTPPYPYRFLPDYAPALAWAGGRRIHYYLGPAAVSLAGEGPLALGSGTWYAVPLPERAAPQFGVVELLSPPGHPEARYDASDGTFKDPSGNAYDVAGNPTS